MSETSTPRQASERTRLRHFRRHATDSAEIRDRIGRVRPVIPVPPKPVHRPCDVCSDADLAHRLGVSLDAVQLTRTSELIDLHLDTFIPVRLWGYDWAVRHDEPRLRGRFFAHVDLPRAIEGGLTGGMWSITTNPLRSARGRWHALVRNLALLRKLFARSEGRLELVRTAGEYAQARARGAIASLVAIQGANALEGAPRGVESIPDRVVSRVTLVHLTNSAYGATSSPGSTLRSHRGLTASGRELIRQLNEARVLVDLAHIHPEGFWDAVEVHDATWPLIDTHTGVAGVRPHWRNLDDRQIRAIADSGGTIGIMFHSGFLRPPGAANDANLIVEHMAHVIQVVGEDFVSVGSDFDGAITPPPELRSACAYPRLVQRMLDRGWSEGRIRKILGGNFLRVLKQIRP